MKVLFLEIDTETEWAVASMLSSTCLEGMWQAASASAGVPKACEAPTHSSRSSAACSCP